MNNITDGRMGRKAFVERLIADHQSEARGYAFNLTRNPDDALDLVQESLRRALRHWRQYDQGRPLKAWFFAIVKNRFLDTVKCRRRQGRNNGGSAGNGDGADFIADNDGGILERLVRKETIQQAEGAMDSVSANLKAVIALCDIDSRKYREAARILRVPIGTVRSRLHRARKTLRRQFAELEENHEDHLQSMRLE